ncbi:MAG: AraC family ligand binding domain-containing protein, partial [Lachnospiraceae bacterium]|nr:AraC family ligand binding domain-containing protein [Lachnospiraceae bacterium]
MDTFNQPHYYDEIPEDILLVYRSNVHHYDIYHRHNGYEIYIFLKGNVNFLVEHSCVHLERGNIAIINPSEYHRAVSLDDSLYERITLNISPATLRRLSTSQTNFSRFFESKQHGVNNIILLPEDILDKLLSLIDSLNDALHSDSFGNDVLQRAYLSQILHLICNNYIVYKHIS